MAYIPSFATEITNINRNDVVYAESVNAFPNPVAGVITTVDNATYIATKPITFNTDVRFEIPDAGTTSFQSVSSGINIFTSNLSGTIPFMSGDIARLNINDASFFSGTGTGKMFDLTSDSTPLFAFNHRNSLIRGFSSIGAFNGGNYFSENVAWILCGEGLTLTDMAIVTMAEQGFIQQTGDHITLDGTLVAANFDRVQAAPSSGDAIFNITATITDKITINDTLISNAAEGTLFAAGSKDQTHPQVIAFNNGNELDSYWAGVFGFPDNAVETEIDFIDTYTDIGGVIVAGLSNERFTLEDGVWTYIGEETIKAIININMSLKKALGASARTVRAALFTDAGSGFVENGSAPLDMDNNIKSFGFTGLEILKKGDRQKIMIKNETNTDNILIVTYDVTVHKA